MTDEPRKPRPTGRNRQKNRERRRAMDRSVRRARRRMARDYMAGGGFGPRSDAEMNRRTRAESMRDAQLEAAFLSRAREALRPQESHSVPGFGDVAYGAVLRVGGLRVSAMRASDSPTVEVVVDTRLEMGLCLTRERLHHRLLEWAGVRQECETGDEAFDSRFWVVGSDLERVRLLLDLKARGELLDLADRVDFEIDDDDATFEFEDEPDEWQHAAAAIRLILYLRARATDLESGPS